MFPGEDRHQRLAEGLEPVRAVPHIEHHQVITLTETGVQPASRGITRSGRVQLLDHSVVLLGSHRHRRGQDCDSHHNLPLRRRPHPASSDDRVVDIRMAVRRRLLSTLHAPTARPNGEPEPARTPPERHVVVRHKPGVRCPRASRPACAGVPTRSTGRAAPWAPAGDDPRHRRRGPVTRTTRRARDPRTRSLSSSSGGSVGRW